jgi:hypothetical protein
MPKITNQLVVSGNCVGGCDYWSNWIVDRINSNSNFTDISGTTIVNNRDSVIFRNSYLISGSAVTNAISSNSGTYCFDEYQNNTYPMSGNPLTFIPSLSGQASTFTNMKLVNSMTNSGKYVRWFYQYSANKPNPTNWNGSDFDLYATVIEDKIAIGATDCFGGDGVTTKIASYTGGTLNIIQPKYFVSPSTQDAQSIFMYVKNL